MRGYCAVGLYMPKYNINVGSVLRAAGCFDASLVVIEGRRYEHAKSDVNREVLHRPLMHGPLRELVPFGCIPVAVDLVDGACSLHSYEHPERAFYVFGPEDGTLGKEVMSWCKQKVYIPSRGCLNLAAAVNVVLYDRDKKRARLERLFDAIQYKRRRTPE